MFGLFKSKAEEAPQACPHCRDTSGTCTCGSDTQQKACASCGDTSGTCGCS